MPADSVAFSRLRLAEAVLYLLQFAVDRELLQQSVPAEESEVDLAARRAVFRVMQPEPSMRRVYEAILVERDRCRDNVLQLRIAAALSDSALAIEDLRRRRRAGSKKSLAPMKSDRAFANELKGVLDESFARWSVKVDNVAPLLKEALEEKRSGRGLLYRLASALGRQRKDMKSATTIANLAALLKGGKTRAAALIKEPEDAREMLLDEPIRGGPLVAYVMRHVLKMPNEVTEAVMKEWHRALDEYMRKTFLEARAAQNRT